MSLIKNSTYFKKAAVYAVTGSILAACSDGEKSEAPLNIIYIMTDDHTEQMISAFDDRFGHTPNIDRLADEGVKFSNSFVANSICGPSRANMLTGKHSHINGKVNNEDYFDGSQQTAPKLLRDAGYQTAMIGKWHLESTPTGFDHWDILPGQGIYYNPDFITEDGVVRRDGYVTDIITDLSIDWIENRKKDKPFTLFLHHKAPHRNWMPKLSDLDYMEDRVFDIPDNFHDDYEGRKAAEAAEMRIGSHHDMDLLYDLKIYDGTQESRLLSMYNVGDSLGEYGRMTPEQKEIWDDFYADIIEDYYSKDRDDKELAEWKYQRYLKEYLKTCKAVDDNIGVLYDYLKSEGLLENTVIIYTSDQGFYMGEHGWFDKRFMYEESLRTPLIIRTPKNMGFSKGTINPMVQNIDHAPTFLDIAGVNIPADIQGSSYLPLLRGETPDNWRESIYYHYQEYPAEHMVKRHFGIRDSRYKLIRFYYDIDEWEFYDLEKDPNEMRNSYGDEQYEEVIEMMKQELRNLTIKYEDERALKVLDGEFELNM
ncbi:sulfatase [Marinilabiliaceae bacterium ANBcel2]|nr:sulfatase [Marinilabiliaceae bacterium ANBcel2]